MTGPGTDPLADATQLLRTRADGRWVEVADRVRSRALIVTRRSLPVRAESPGGSLDVSRAVVVACLREALAPLPDLHVEDIEIVTDDAGTLTGVTVVVAVRFGTDVLELADDVRGVAAATLREVLGEPVPGEVAPAVTVRPLHLHVQDVYDGALGPE